MEKSILKRIKKNFSFKKKIEEVNEVIAPKKENTNKNNIQILKDDPQLLFMDEVTISDKSINNKDEKKEVIKKKKKPKVQQQNTKKNIDKNDIKIFSSEEDLLKAFEKGEKNNYSRKKIIVKPQKKQPLEETSNTGKKLKNKNGIKVLDNSQDIASAFLNSNEAEELRQVNYKSEYAILRAKKDLPIKKEPVSLDKRLSRYPAPELTLDLHGFSSVQAKLKSENFILSAWNRGYFTLRIITGKGTHSESGAVLPDIVEDLVKEMTAEKKILSHKWENQSGSMIIYLNRFD